MRHVVLDQLQATLRREAPEVFAGELARRFGELRSAGMVAGRVVPAAEAEALLAGLGALAIEALPGLCARDPLVALDVVESARLPGQRGFVERALVERFPHLGPLLEVFAVRAPARVYLLSAWLKEIAAATGRLSGGSRDDFVAATGESLEPWASKADGDSRWRFGRAGAGEVWKLLVGIALNEELATHGGVRWVHMFDYKDSDAWPELPAMLGVPVNEAFWAEVRALGQRARERGDDFVVNDFADVCNARAHALGKELRLFAVNAHGDSYLFVALPPAACKAAALGGLIAVIPHLSRISLASAKPTGRLARLLPWLLGGLGLLLAIAIAWHESRHLGAVLAVIGLIVAFEVAKHAAIQALDRAFGARHPGVIRVIKALTRT